MDKGGTVDAGKSNDDRDEVTETSSASFSSSDDSSPPDGNPSPGDNPPPDGIHIHQKILRISRRKLKMKLK